MPELLRSNNRAFQLVAAVQSLYGCPPDPSTANFKIITPPWILSEIGGTGGMVAQSAALCGFAAQWRHALAGGGTAR